MFTNELFVKFTNFSSIAKVLKQLGLVVIDLTVVNAVSPTKKYKISISGVTNKSFEPIPSSIWSLESLSVILSESKRNAAKASPKAHQKVISRTTNPEYFFM
ncbi:MAG: hypothetical protein LBP35_06595 [Candidatus Ancillula trichonymphae]|jgi:hypothetical protein|nr:hypothetical protein [Candidatus Ancillula trichonymphae]